MPRSILVFTEICFLCATLVAISTTYLNLHLNFNPHPFTFTGFVPYLGCLIMIQVFYLRQSHKTSFVFSTNLVTLGLVLCVFYLLPEVKTKLPILTYYGVHTFVLTICEAFYLDAGPMLKRIKKQTWINKMPFLNRMLPKKNLSHYVLSSTVSFCYAALNLCALLSHNALSIPEYVALSVTCVLLGFSATFTFALLVNCDDLKDIAFPGCVLIHYFKQSYQRCKSLYSGKACLNANFSFKSLVFVIILSINALGFNAFAMPAEIMEDKCTSPASPVSEGQVISRTSSGVSWVGRAMLQGLREAPRNTTSSTGGLATGAIIGYGYNAMTNTGEEAGPSEQPDNVGQCTVNCRFFRRALSA